MVIDVVAPVRRGTTTTVNGQAIPTVLLLLYSKMRLSWRTETTPDMKITIVMSEIC